MWGLILSLPRVNLCAFDIPLACSFLCWGFDSPPNHVSAPPTCLDLAFPSGLQLWNSYSPSLQVVLRVVLHVVAALICLWEEVNSVSSYFLSGPHLLNGQFLLPVLLDLALTFFMFDHSFLLETLSCTLQHYLTGLSS